MKIIIYGADWCKDTKLCLRYFKDNMVDNIYRNIDTDKKAKKEFEVLTKNKKKNIPRILIINNNKTVKTLVEPQIQELDSVMKKYKIT